MIAIITARGGSKGIPRKNLKLLRGTPLIVHTIDSARAAASVSSIVVSSDDAEILDISDRAGALPLLRPAELATDDARSEDAVRHALTHLPAAAGAPARFALLQPTSPLRSAGDIDGAAALADANPGRCVIGVTEAEHHPFKMLVVRGGVAQPVGEIADLSAPRQRLPRALRPNGALYLSGVREFLETGSLWTDPRFYEMPARRSLDLDSELDWTLAEMILAEEAGETGGAG